MVPYRDHRYPPLVSILSQMNPVHTLINCSFKIHSNTILPSTSRSMWWINAFSYFDRYFVCISDKILRKCFKIVKSYIPGVYSIKLSKLIYQFKLVHCQHGTACPHVADEVVQISKINVTVLNKSLRKAKKVSSYSFKTGRRM
jgi:hypothetical protein